MRNLFTGNNNNNNNHDGKQMAAPGKLLKIYKEIKNGFNDNVKTIKLIEKRTCNNFINFVYKLIKILNSYKIKQMVLVFIINMNKYVKCAMII